MTMGVTGTMFCVLMLLLQTTAQQQTFNDKEELNLSAKYKIGWMQSLNDDTLISEVTIPGTHDTMALLPLPGSQSQSWSLENQLNAGIRYLDLRVYGRFMIIVHGVIPQFTTFAKVFNTTKNFLSQYKTETVLIRVKEEFGGNIPEKVINQLKNDPGCWVSDQIPRIGDVRGKIVFVQKNSFKLGIPLIETDQRGDFKVKNINQKKDKIADHLKQALGTPKTDRAVLSYSSGTGLAWKTFKYVAKEINLFETDQKGDFKVKNISEKEVQIFDHFKHDHINLCWLLKTPKCVAKEINPWLYGYLGGISKQNPKRCFGIIAMDFPGFDLIQQIIGFNK